MANQVYANSMEISCKAANGKSACAFPDVCMTPPQTPATPPGVPIPYPNTGMASDCTDGSSTVQISGQEVMLKNKSYFKKSTGDEAGSAPMKGVVTHQNTGKVYFNAWSMDVKVEGENVVRHLDLTTHNHASVPGNTAVWPYIDETWLGVDVWVACQKDIGKEYDACKECQPRNPEGPNPCAGADGSLINGNKPGGSTVDAYSKKIMANECLKARRCVLQPYDKTEKGKGGCCDGQTGHHLVEASSFMIDRTVKGKIPGILEKTSYDPAKAPCICVEGTNQYHGTHGLMHTFQSTAAIDTAKPGSLTFLRSGSSPETHSFEHTTTYGEAKSQALDAADKTFPKECDRDCLEAQLDAYHNQCDIGESTPCKSVITGHHGEDWVKKATAKVEDLAGTTVGSD